eukprot:TRINITY_DN22502_c0_g1_i2.p1 TRINITY_DN22502_c0_g1~~TRINITY_DN22502_c0_g1_i2.p1  ORF type:complete len:706 (+),score=204.97 TRINITY_DN22502_c0_g1_i2:103-2118(+)
MPTSSFEELKRARKQHRLVLDDTPPGRSKHDTESPLVGADVVVHKRPAEPSGAVWDEDLVLCEVKQGSAAERAGLVRHLGDVLVSVNGVAVHCHEDAVRETQGRSTLRLGLANSDHPSHEHYTARKKVHTAQMDHTAHAMRSAHPEDPEHGHPYEEVEGSPHWSHRELRRSKMSHQTDMRRAPGRSDPSVSFSPDPAHPYQGDEEAPHYSQEAFRRKKIAHSTGHLSSPPRFRVDEQEVAGTSTALSRTELERRKKLHQHEMASPPPPRNGPRPGAHPYEQHPDQLQYSQKQMRENIARHRSDIKSSPRRQQYTDPEPEDTPRKYTSHRLMHEHKQEHIAAVSTPRPSDPASPPASSARAVSQAQYQRDKHLHLTDTRSPASPEQDVLSNLRTSELPPCYRTQDMLRREKKLHLRSVTSPQTDEHERALTRVPEHLDTSQRAMQRAKQYHLTRDDLGMMEDAEHERQREATSVPSHYTLDRLQGSWLANDGTAAEVRGLDVRFGTGEAAVTEKLQVVRGTVQLLGHRVVRVEPTHSGPLVRWSDGDCWRRPKHAVEELRQRLSPERNGQRSHQQPPRPRSGAVSLLLRRDRGEKLGLTWDGKSLVLRAVLRGSPADRAGANDCIGMLLCRVNGRPYNDALDLADGLSRAPLRSAETLELEFEELPPVDVSM